MRRTPRYSPAAHAVLERFVAVPSRWFHGYTLMQELELASGTLYPVLMRLAEGGWLETSWETPGRTGRPARHRYRLAPRAAADARDLLRRWSARGLAHPVPRHAT